ncbi:MAG: hypothetical protein KBT66_16160 [Amphritea sp.]|nr:hypothetical protein [Amphritea sp.]
MKKLILIALFAGGVYLVMMNQSEDIDTTSYGNLLNKADTSVVSVDDVKNKANLLAQFLCNDVTFQTTGLSTVSSCMDKYSHSKERCEDQVFGNAPAVFSGKVQVTDTVKEFISCVGIE